MDSEQEHSEITIIDLLQQIRQIDKEAAFNIFTHSLPFDPNSLHLHPYLQCLHKVQDELSRYRLLEDEYKKLEHSLQKQETEIRKRISIEQQLKLYTDALKAQVEQVEKEKLQLLQNSKLYIKSLKSSNEKLYLQLCKAKASKPASPSKPNKSLSHNKPKHDKSIREIIKTEYIERNHSNSAQQKKHNKSKKVAYSTISGHEASETLQENSKTFYLAPHSNKKEKLNSHPSKKKNKFLFSNYTLLNYLESSNRKLKKQDKNHLAKSPPKVKRERNSRWKQKKANKSTFCIASVEPASNKKETI